MLVGVLTSICFSPQEKLTMCPVVKSISFNIPPGESNTSSFQQLETLLRNGSIPFTAERGSGGQGTPQKVVVLR